MDRGGLDSVVINMTISIPRPKADRTQLQQIIAGLPEGVIIIDPDQTIAWCNKAALTMHAVTSLEELGHTVSEYRERFELRYRNSHKLPAGDYPMDRVIAGEAFTEVVVEVTVPGEERHRVQQIRSMIITDPAGDPDCLVLILEDETERFSAEERFERTFNANPAPAIIVRLGDGRYVKVNQGFMELTGFVEEALIGRSMHEYDLLDGAEKREQAVERLHAGLTIPQMEARLRTATGDRRLVILAGQPIEIGTEACMLFTFADLQPHKQAQDALNQSEQRFAVAFRLAPMPMAIIAMKGLHILDVNDAFTSATGWQREQIVGRTEPELGLWGGHGTRERLESQLTQTGHLRGADIQVKLPGDRISDFQLSAEAVTIHGEPCALLVMVDVTQRKQSEAELLTAIEAVMQDTSWFGQRIVEKLASLTARGPATPTGPTVSDLTPRARDVLALLAQGLGDEEVSKALGMSRNTIKNHVSAMYKVIGVHRRSELVVWARERGLGIKAKTEHKQHFTDEVFSRPVKKSRSARRKTPGCQQ